jgi:uncharacterized protein YndB with AHSA1/START domain
LAPQRFTIERSITIAAPAEAIFPFIADFREWKPWSPWEGLDPSLERTYGGPAGAVGGSYAWKGNRKAGQGSMIVTEVVAPQSVSMKLDFLKPFKASNRAIFTLDPDPAGAGTVVKWTMSGENAGLAKLFAKVVPTDKLVGGDFEKGLASLKRVARNR